MTTDEFVATMLLLGALRINSMSLHPMLKLLLPTDAEINFYSSGTDVFFTPWKVDSTVIEALLGLESYKDYPYQTIIDHLVIMLEKINDQR